MIIRVVLLILVVAVLGLGGGAGFYYVTHHRSALVRAEADIAAGKLREALLELREHTRSNPGDGRALLLLGTVHSRLGDLPAAERDITRALAQGADRSAVVLQLAPIYMANRQYAELLARVPRTGPNAATTARYQALRSRALLATNDLPAATVALEAARAAAAGEPEVSIAAARLALARNDAAAAEAATDAAIQADPKQLEALLLKSQLRGAADDGAAALAFADRAVAAEPSLPTPRLARANLLVAQGQDAKALADTAIVLESQPRNATAMYLNGVVAVRQERFTEASTWLEGLGAASSRFPRANYFQAMAALGKRLPATAVQFANRYMAQYPAEADGMRLLARAQIADNRPDLAMKLLADAVARGETDTATLDLYGTALAGTGNLQAASATLARAVTQSPDSGRTQVQYADIQVQQGRAGEAVETLQRLREQAPDEVRLLQPLVVAQIAAGKLDGAAATLAMMREKLGATEAVGILTGMIALGRLDPAAAVTAFSDTLKAFPNSTVAQIDLAKALTAAGRIDEAAARLNAGLSKAPADLALLQNLVQLEIGRGRPAAATTALEAARAAEPNSDAVTALLADTQLRAGRPQDAIASVVRASAFRRTPPQLMPILAQAYDAASRPVDAAAAYRELLGYGPNPAAALALAELEQRRRNLPAARQVLDEAIGQTPADFALLTRRVSLEPDAESAVRVAEELTQRPGQMPVAALLAGDALVRAGRPAAAVSRYKAARAVDKGVPVTLRLAEAQLAASDTAGAVQTLRDVPEDPGAAVLLARLAVASKDWPAAIPQLERALKGRPEDAGLLNNLAWSYQEAGDPRARATAQRAFLLDPSPDTADTLGWILVQTGAAATAVPILRQASGQRPADPTLAYHLAVALQRTGDVDGAARLVTSTLAAHPSFDDRAAAVAFAGTLPQPR